MHRPIHFILNTDLQGDLPRTWTILNYLATDISAASREQNLDSSGNSSVRSEPGLRYDRASCCRCCLINHGNMCRLLLQEMGTLPLPSQVLKIIKRPSVFPVWVSVCLKTHYTSGLMRLSRNKAEEIPSIGQTAPCHANIGVFYFFNFWI